MERWAFTSACTFGLALVTSGSSAQTSHAVEHPAAAVGGASPGLARPPVRPVSRLDGASGQISTTADNQILVELTPEDAAPAHLFDLNGRTLIFTPDGSGGYARDVRALTWEADIGEPVADRAEIDLSSFLFYFAGRRWGSFYVSKHGALTFGEPLTYEYWGPNWFATMREHANRFVAAPTISPFYKPILGGQDGETSEAEQQHVSVSPERVVVTWTAREPFFYVHAQGYPQQKPARFQAVLRADGSIAFNYVDVSLGDGIVGLFTAAAELTRGAVIASLPDVRNPELPGHLDLLDMTIYATNTDAVILEFTTREPIPEPPDGTIYSYRLYFDTDEPYWVEFGDGSDMDFLWMIQKGGRGGGGTIGGVPFGAGGNRIALLADISELAGLSAAVIAHAAEFSDDGRWIRGHTSGVLRLELPPAAAVTDLSEPDTRFSSASAQREVFSYRGVPDLEAVACRVIEALGEEFDLFIFHNEFRVDTQVSASPWRRYSSGAEQGIGNRPHPDAPCGGGRLKGLWERPVWVYALHEDSGFRRDLALFVHEFTHTWTAYLSFEKDGRREPLFDESCNCHWRVDLHTAAAFPRRATEAMSIMGGRFWQDNGDGTFTPHTRYNSAGPSWLDLYAMGLARADEVPDTFILRDLEVVEEVATTWPDGHDGGLYRGRKEIISIEQIVAAEGPREPPAAAAQKAFNAAFVYLLEPGHAPNADLLRLHAAYRDTAIEHWSRVTGGRSRMTTTVPSAPNRSPAAVGTLPDLTLHVGGTPAVVDVASAFRDPDGDPLTYQVASSAPAVATAVVAGSQATLTPVSVGMVTATVTATDTGGSSARQRFAVAVTAPATFTDHPIRPGTTPIKAVHFRELRERIAALRTRWGLPAVGWTDPTLLAGVTPVRLVHLRELRSALAEAYAQAGRAAPRWSDTAPAAGTTPVRAVHLMELRAAVVELE